MKRLGRNRGGYHGETLEIRAVLGEIKSLAGQFGWGVDLFYQIGDLELFALHRPAKISRPEVAPCRVYISTGIHGDEPAGPLAALRLLQENRWPAAVDLWLLPCLNPTGFVLNSRENDGRLDLNRDYRQMESEEVAAHVRWLERQPSFDLTLCLHEDWESEGFYLYELNPDLRPSLASAMLERVREVCLIDLSPMIEGRPAQGGLITPTLDPAARLQWPEAFWLLQYKTRQSYTLEAPSDFSLPIRVSALVTAVEAALGSLP